MIKSDDDLGKQQIGLKDSKREVEILVLSDIHLGTYGCRAKELHRYMKSIKPQRVILNGDIIDMWQFKKSYFPKSHLRIINRLLKWTRQGVQVHYLTGNHDEMLRKFSGNSLGNLHIDNKLVLELDEGKAWFFHGDVFDVTMRYSKWLARLGAYGYDLLILINTFCNWVSQKLGRGRISLSKNIKKSVKSAVKFINGFETICMEIASERGYSFVACGHIHQPEIRTAEISGRKVTYLNSGDWIENLTALEYHQGGWTLYRYSDHHYTSIEDDSEIQAEMVLMDNSQIFTRMFEEMNLQSN
ncbi:MAG: UDP-2,3-diacylglucosamine diphosphatase [Bacteroidota bacterium]